MTSDLAGLWAALEKSSSEPGITGRRFLLKSPLDVFVGVENPGRLRLLFIEAPRVAFPSTTEELPQSAGVSVALESVGSPGAKRRLVVRLTSPTSRDIFTALVSDLLSVLERQANAREAVAAFASRLEKWQRLLARQGPDGLSVQEQIGLFGELLFLRDFMLQECPAADAIDAWTGPLAKDQDFQLASCSVEVKASAGNPQQEVHVSNVRQLDETAGLGRPLFLFHVSLEARHRQGETINGIVDEVRRLAAVRLEKLNALLFEAGYLDCQAQRYATTGYVTKNMATYRVVDGFPRILENDLRKGVGRVTYSISLSACEPFSVSELELRAAIRGQS